MTVTRQHTAAVYARLSTEDTDALAVARQREDCRARADREGLEVVAEYAEDRASAYSGKRRPEYERLLGDMAAGVFGVLLVWRLDRLARNLGDYARAHEAAEAGRVRIVGVADGVDTATPAGEFTANVMFSVARQESRTTSARVARRAEQAAKAGKPHGGPRPFGWHTDRVTPRDDEAAVIGEACERILAGESLRSVAVDLERRGVTAPQTGRGLSPQALRTILTSPRNAGLRRHRSAEGVAVYPAQWPAIIDRDKWEQVVARLAGNGSKKGRPATYLLAGMLRCGRCSQTLVSGTTAAGYRRYACRRGPGREGCGRLVVSAAGVEGEVTEQALAALAGPDLAGALAEPDDTAAEAGRDLADAEDRLEQLAGMFADGQLSRREWQAARDRCEQRIAAARRVLDAQAAGNVLAGLPETLDALRERWDAEGIDWRRSVLRAVVDHVEIAASSSTGGRFDPERVRIIWRA